MIVVEKPILKKEGDYNIIISNFIANEKSFDIWYRSKNEICLSSDCFLISALIPAMKLNETLKIEGHISEKLYKSLEKIQDVYTKNYPELKKVEIIADVSPCDYDSPNVASSFFTCGVDSFYTLLKHIDEISNVVYVHGFDVWMSEVEYRSMMSDHVNSVCRELKKNIIEVETNLHEFSDNFVGWDIYHPSALASVAMLLCSHTNKMYMASSFNQRELAPEMGPSELDRLWSTEKMEIVPDGFEANRFQKTIKVSVNGSFKKHVHVCLGDRRSLKYNCSKCEKCIRTMIPLYESGEIGSCEVFDMADDFIDLVSNMEIKSNNSRMFAIENFNGVSSTDIKLALKKAMDRHQIHLP